MFIILGRKQHFWAQKGTLWAIGAEKWPAERPNGHLPENRRYPELPQDMGDLWSHWVRSVWPKKWGLYGCSVKKCRFLGQKCSFSAQSQFFSDIVHNYCHHYDWTHKRQHFCVDPVARQASGRPSGPILPDFGRLWQFLTNAKKWHFLGFAPSSHHFF